MTASLVIMGNVARGKKLSGMLGLAAASLLLAMPAPASAAKNPVPGAYKWIEAQLAKRSLKPTKIECHYGGGGKAVCRFDATKTVNEWTFDCRGHARRGGGIQHFGRCPLTGPDLAPLLSTEQIGPYHPTFGLNEDWTLHPNQVNLARALGSQTARVPFQWNEVEFRRGRYDFAAYDRVYTEMQARGISPILAINGSPCWARPSTTCTGRFQHALPPDREFLGEWKKFVRITLRRYPSLAGVEVWNEPNLNGFWGPKPEPKRYAKLLKATARTVQKVSPRIPVIFGGLVPQFGPAPRGMDSRHFQRRAFKAGAWRWIDAFGVHPYVFPSDDPNLIVSVRAQMAVPKGIAARFGIADMPLWVTEFGLSTTGDGALSQTDQAVRLVAVYQTLRRIPGVPVVILHRLADLPPVGNDWQAGMGLLTQRGAFKPAFCAMALTRTNACNVN
jgi:hypothetical protein